MLPQDIAIIFDMDGVLVDNMAFHVKSWMFFCQKHQIPLTIEEYNAQLNGKNAKDSLEYLFKRKFTAAEVDELIEEKEEVYRELYLPHIAPANGLVDLLESLKSNGIKLAIGTSAPKTNIDFTLNHTGLRPYFDVIIDASMITHGKPAPDIYLKAAEALQVPPSQCIVAEDALMGVQAGLAAGMKVIGVMTTHTREELAHTDLQIQDFTELSLEKLINLLQ